MGNNGKIIFIILVIGIFISISQTDRRKISQDPLQSSTLLQGEDKNSNLGSTTPHTATSSLAFNNSYIYFTVNEKGNLINTPPNLYYDEYYHLYQSFLYLSINDIQVSSLLDFTVEEVFHNLTKYDPTNISLPLVAEIILQHPSLDVHVKMQFKVYPGKSFFLSTFMVYSPTLSSFKAELFYYMDMDIDGYNSAGFNNPSEYKDDYAAFDVSTNSIYQYDTRTYHYIGWNSPITPNAWEVGLPSDILDDIDQDTLENNTNAEKQDCAAVTKYVNASIPLNQTWTIPIIFGFGSSLSTFLANSHTLKNECIRDFSILNIIRDGSGLPAVTATILNGGMYTSLRNVSLFLDNIYFTSQDVYLKAGEYQSLLFSNLDLIIGNVNVIRVQVENITQDFDNNDYSTLSWLFQKLFSMKIQDFELNNLPNVNASFYLQGNNTFITSQQTNSIGNISIYGLSTNDYIVVLTALWWNNEQIASLNISYPACGDYITFQTNITTLQLHITDVEGYILDSIGVLIYRSSDHKFMFANYTDSSGNVTFFWLRSNYDIYLNYTNFDHTIQFSPILGFLLNSSTFLTQTLSLTRFILHFHTRSTQEPLVNAKIEFYNRTTDFTYGEYISYKIADLNGNVSILWANFINYSIRVKFYSEYKLIGDPQSNAFNLTESPFLTYQFAEINVTLQTNLEEYTTELVRKTELPLVYSWEDNISIEFIFNVTGPSGSTGPQWADYTNVIIRDDNWAVIFNGSAENVISEIGLHTFILNTSCGVFIAGNPAIYNVQINALLTGYSPPNNPLDFSFKLYNITTRLSINQSSVDIYWNDNVTIQANFFESPNEHPIVDADLTVSWGSYLNNVPMQSLGNGSYIFQIHSSLGSPSTYNVFVHAEKPNYNSYEQRFLITIKEVPTLLNGSLIFDSTHVIYVTTQNLTLQYHFIDSVRSIPITGITPNYQIINEETGEEHIGVLDELGSGFYLLDPTLSLFPIGNYHGVVQFYHQYYITSYAIFRITILSIPTTLNDSAIQAVPYEIYCNSNFRINFTYRNILNSTLIANASVSYQILNQALNLNATYEMEEIATGLYEFNPYSINLPIGTYIFNLNFQKMNYSSDGVSFTIFIREIPTLLNGTGLAGSIQMIYVSSSFTSILNFSDYLGNPINQVNATYEVSKLNSTWRLNGHLIYSGSSLYRFLPGTDDFPFGTFQINLKFSHMNYTDKEINFNLIINEIPTLINSTAISGSVNEIYITTSFLVFFHFRDYLDHSISQVDATYIITKTNSSWILEGNLTRTPLGLFLFDPNTASFSAGTYRCYLSFDHVNYTDQDFSYHIVVKEIPMNLELFGNTIDNRNIPITSSYSISRSEKLILLLELKDIFEIPMINCVIQSNLSKEGITMQGEFLNVGDGVYQVTFPKMKSVGAYTLSLVILAQNHSKVEKIIFIEVVWQRILTLPLPYWFVIIGLVVTVGIGFTTYRVIHNALIPPMVKKLNWLEKVMKHGHSFSSDVFVSKEEVFRAKFADRWAQLDLEHPFVPVSSHIISFIELYEQYTGKSLFVEDAIHYMEDLSIYSQNEILARLKADGIPDNRIFIALQIIEAFVQENNSGETPKNDDNMTEMDK